MANANMIDIMEKDGKHALKSYLPDICRVMKEPVQDSSKIISVFNEYLQVFKGGVKDQFMEYRSKYSSEKWQKVNFTYVLLLYLWLSFCGFKY